MPEKGRAKGKGMRTKYAFPEWPGLVIYQRKDAGDNWYVRFPLKVKGFRPYKFQLLREGGEKDGAPTTNIDTAKQWALMQYGAVLNAVKKGDVGSLFDKTLDEVISEYVAEVKMDPTRGKSAIKRAVHSAIPLRRYFRECGIRIIGRLTTEIAKGYINWRLAQSSYRGTPIAPTTVMHEMQILNQILDHAVDKRYIRYQDRPKATFSVSLKKRTKRDGFTSDEWKILEDWLWEWPTLTVNGRTRERREHLRDYCIFLYYSGMRPGEAMNLQNRDIHIQDAANGEEMVILDLNEGKTGERDVVAMPEVADAIRRLRKREIATGPNDFLFINEHGEKLGVPSATFSRMLEDLYLEKDADLRIGRTNQKRTPYSLRHTYADTRLMEGDVNVFDLSENMGTSVQMIKHHYKHARNSAKAKELTHVKPEFKPKTGTVEQLVDAARKAGRKTEKSKPKGQRFPYLVLAEDEE
ncbi:tyrosine-type recombinase/integrase [Magnetospirillum sp. 15-1]|uniref:tyrosine-type recombinase/integrase n=1 Tax=Magnetospirillum sp. 15-1 TaxID=1979370 RepID=UPI000BBC991C|nr:tyrosine-type recombinase/integrase [Magnetospirillum sp. 15-1]